MTYDGAIRFLYDLQLFGAKFGLENTRRLASLAGNPQEKLRFIHVAGTNGKGSVCAMLESIYRASGHQTGLYTSPHLVHFGERIRVGNQNVDEQDIVALTTRMQAILSEGANKGWWDSIDASSTGAHGHPTFFEVVTVMALMHFAGNKCDIVLWETGMGGRLDATNIVTPLASVITNVALEHSAYLGNTIEKIAAEKCGIIKPRTPVFTGAQDKAALTVIREVAKSRNCSLMACNSTGNDEANRLFPHSYQQQNARLAIAVARALSPVLEANGQHIESGLKNITLPARLQTIERGRQTFLIDGAHNPASIKALRGSLENKQPTIFGCFDDKDLTSILNELLPMVSDLHLVPINSPRTAQPGDVARVVNQLDPTVPVQIHDSLIEALKTVPDRSRVLITGSLYLAGEALAALTDPNDRGTENVLNDWRDSTR